MKNFVKFAAIAAVLTASCAPAFAIRANDFTKANKSFSSKYKSDKSSLNDKNWSSGERRFEKKDFSTDANNGDLSSRRASMPDGTGVSGMNSSRYSKGKDTFTSPELNGLDGKWRDDKKEWSAKNPDRDFSKKYEGKIDFEKRSKYVDYLKEAYSDMNERSMQDINKYQFRSSHSSDPGVKTTEAGSNLRQEDANSSSFWDFLTGDKHIERTPVKLTGPKNRNAIRNENSSEAAEKTLVPSPKNEEPLPSAKFAPPAINSAGTNSNLSFERNKKSANKQVQEKEIDMETAKGLRFMKMPDNMRGKASIKVQVDNGDL